MNARTITIAVALLVAGVAWGQPDSVWIKTYLNPGIDNCNSIVATQDGGFALAATSIDDEGRKFFVIKANSDGDSLWSVKLGLYNSNDCTRMIGTVDGGVALAGYVGSENWDDYLLVKLSEDGDSLWSRSYGQGHDDSEKCTSIIQTVDGGYALCGWFNTYNVNILRTWLLVTDENGDSLWSEIYDPSVPLMQDIRQTEDGGFLMVGGSEALKTDDEGNIEWTRVLGEDVMCHRIIEAIDGYAITGITSDYEPFLSILNPDGEIQWFRTYEGFRSVYQCSIAEADDDGFLLGVSSYITGAEFIRTNSNGDSLWSASYSGGEITRCGSIVAIPNAGYAIGGDRFWFNEELFLLRMPDQPFVILEDSLAVNPTVVPQPNSLFLSAYPNPFNSSTRISFMTGSAAQPARLAIFDPLGRRVAELIPDINSPFNSSPASMGGKQSVVWDASGVPAGQYIIRLETGNQQLSQRLSLVK